MPLGDDPSVRLAAGHPDVPVQQLHHHGLYLFRWRTYELKEALSACQATGIPCPRCTGLNRTTYLHSNEANLRYLRVVMGRNRTVLLLASQVTCPVCSSGEAPHSLGSRKGATVVEL